MKPTIQLVRPPSGYPYYYGVVFASARGIPVLFERKYIIKKKEDMPKDGVTPPPEAVQYLIDGLRSSAKRAGVKLEDYPEFCYLCNRIEFRKPRPKKLTAVDITNAALKALGDSPQASTMSMDDFNKMRDKWLKNMTGGMGGFGSSGK